MSESRSTHFGYQTVSEEEKAGKVKEVFTRVADSYDLMNDVMSAGVHRFWKRRFVEKLNPDAGSNILDVAGGTGDITFRLVDHILRKLKSPRHGHGNEDGQTDMRTSHPKTQITVCDINENMLRVGEERSRHLKHLPSRDIQLSWLAGDAMKLPFPDNTFDCYTIAFGIRNVVDIEKALDEAHRVLKPGGVFSCLEFSQVQNPLLESFYDWYSFQVIPVQGEIFAGDWNSYQYLVESIRKFPDQDDFAHLIETTGFKLVNYENLTNGVASIHSGYKDV
ncbi:2-methoxy-6-polyprenyl-1,4-benzoquinol methylase, mitochondrial [Halotydeus destructor]|nr:2-methoxy-6-polyprenyl-1,4-benzoquinol methylase, mitochondrial [Halotydeus destructor]